MTGPAGSDLYTRDFYAWTEDQAARLRKLVGDNRFDVEHVAEEIEDLGDQKLNAVASYLAQTIAHLLKLPRIDDPHLVNTWRESVALHQDEACYAATPRIRQKLDITKLWQRGLRLANESFRTHGEPELTSVPRCPFTLDELLSEAFDIDEALVKLGRVTGEDEDKEG